MKTMKAYTYLLLGIAISLMCACSEDTFSPNNIGGGKNVTITLSCCDVSPRDVTVSTRATDAEERHLNNLYIYIFDDNGKLKGFKEVTSEKDLNQNTSNDNRAEISGIKTKTGASYIYAVANINTGLYPITTSEGKVEEGKLPVGLDEKKAQAGEYADFTLNKLKALTFDRTQKTIDITSAFLMSGAIDNGNEVSITDEGAITLTTNNTSKDIKLSRIVAKIRVNYRAAEGKTFTLDNYDIINIATNGSLIGKDINNPSALTDTDIEVNNLTQRTRNVTDTWTDSNNQKWNYMEFYLPENLQQAKNTVSTWHAREDDSQSNPKVFTNAPAKGTYLVLHGSYSDSDTDGTKRTATVTYYIHLGDCTDNVNDYNVERNCKYTFNITVQNINQIKLEAEKTSNNQPGAEGVILNLKKTGKSCQLDAHYDYMVMRFYQDDVKNVVNSALGGYSYLIEDFNGKSDIITVTKNGATGETNGATTDWIEFAIGGTFGTNNDGKGTACAYPGKKNGKMNEGLYSLNGFFQEMANNASKNSFWTQKDKNGRYIDVTCFVNENYYPTHNWSEYVNGVTKRNFFVADEIKVSEDKRSVYAGAIYGLTQYNIQTFYDRSQDDNIVAYGCETINDEEGKNITTSHGSNGNDKWNGRANFLKDIGTAWSTYENNTDLRYACLSRNRDLNGDGAITDDEVRWYTPTSAQYAGLWIGEDILSTEAKLYKKDPTILNTEGDSGRMLYYTTTNGENNFWSEEGMATSNIGSTWGSKLNYVRCIRNLKSKDNDEGYKETPVKYFTWDKDHLYMTLDKVDEQAVNTTGETGELVSHTERSATNKPARTFYVANSKLSTDSYTQKDVVEGTFKCNGNYTQDGKTWRVPNQREFCLMYIVASEGEGLSLSGGDLNDAFVRTYFSGATFRKTWRATTNNMNMEDKWWSSGYVRCISPTK